MIYYSYPPGQTDVSKHLVGANSTRSHFEVTFTSPHQMPWPEGNTVYGELFEPRDAAGRVPLLILSHGWGDESLAPCLTVARLLVRQGIAAFVLYLPIHSRRQPGGITRTPAPAEWPVVYQSAVKEIRKIVDWALTRKEMDPGRLGVAGISMGGIISAIAMAVDDRIHSGIFLVTGGNMEDVSWGGDQQALPIGHACTREECHAVYTQYPRYLAEVEQLGLDRAVPTRECFLSDPVTFASRLRSRHIMMINADHDEIVSKQATLKLNEAFGHPPLVWVPGSHAAVYSQAGLVASEIVKFLGAG